jgi:dGTPase
MKVSQVARRLGDLISDQASRMPSTYAPTVKLFGRGICPEVCEAAALAHDLGTPPFGHTGEALLDRLVVAHGDPDGFEGNAQTFRILTRLEVHKSSPHGVDLSRATLRAVLKYPWHRSYDQNSGKYRKWGAYRSDSDAFEFAMKLPVKDGNRDWKRSSRSLEAEVMDWSDDITYAIHDLEDFYRAGLVPLDRISLDRSYAKEVMSKVLQSKQVKSIEADEDEVLETWKKLTKEFPTEPFTGTDQQLRHVYRIKSDYISTLMAAFKVRTKGSQSPSILILRPQVVLAETLKALTWMYVLESPALATQRSGQERIVEELFKICFQEAVEGSGPKLLPPRFVEDDYLSSEKPARIAADFVSSLTEPEAHVLYKKVCGIELGSVRDISARI